MPGRFGNQPAVCSNIVAMTVEVIVLAAGKGTRMWSQQPKVLLDLAGRPLLEHVITTLAGLETDRVHVVYGHGADQVLTLSDHWPGLNWVCQDQQLGTGHAVLQALPAVADGATVLVVYGDVPLIRYQTLEKLVRAAGSERLAVLTCELPDPAGYGRVLRGTDGRVTGIVEEKDASPAEQAVSEINTGFLAAPAARLKEWLNRVDNQNAQGEYYLTDIVGHAVAAGTEVATCSATDRAEIRGVNTRGELALLERVYQLRQAERFMEAGLSLRDPARFDVRGTLEFAAECSIDVNVVVAGHVTLGERVSIGPNCYLRDCTLADGVTVSANSVIEGATVGNDCSIGPFARLRSGTRLAENSRVGNFVELKASRMGPGSKANHLAYVGDAEVGSNVNIGAGVITCNYDGASKHKTVIGDNAFIGSNSQLVAPVKVGAGATIGAGSTISRNAEEGKLTLTRSKQVTIDHWQRPKTRKKNPPA